MQETRLIRRDRVQGCAYYVLQPDKQKGSREEDRIDYTSTQGVYIYTLVATKFKMHCKKMSLT